MHALQLTSFAEALSCKSDYLIYIEHIEHVEGTGIDTGLPVLILAYNQILHVCATRACRGIRYLNYNK